MTETDGIAVLKFGGPSTYRINVQGTLDPSYVGRLGGMTLKSPDREDDSSCTILIGNVRDQAELNGILETLYGLHLPILSVKRTRD